ncbi:MAG: FKBP-type peptidyl-prolyl cis-trans isomerase [Terriglobales bacterium]
MRKPFLAAVLLTAGTTFVANGNAQQTPAATAPQTSATSPKQTPPATDTSSATGPLKTKTEKFSYALGMNIGTDVLPNLRKESIDLDPAMFTEGLKDALAGKTLLTDEEADALVKEIQVQIQETQLGRIKDAMDKNKVDSEAFLAANKEKQGVVTLPSGLQYKILTQGSGPKPTLNDTVVCNYRGTLIDGTEISSTYHKGQPATFKVNHVLKGWTEALQLMPVGSKWQIVLPPSLAYGDQGVGKEILPYSTLIFEIELLSIEKKDDAKADAKTEDKKPADPKLADPKLADPKPAPQKQPQ